MQALVSGGTGGIGRAIAIALAEAGHGVVVLGRSPAEPFGLHGIRTIAVDVTDRAALDDALRDLSPDILINNAGMMPPLGPFWTMDPADIDRVLAVNLSAALHLTRAVLPGMVARAQGHIFFTGSTAGHAPFANIAAYAASKSAIGGFAQSLRLDVAPHGIRVTEIVAGRVETGLYRNILSEEARRAMYDGNSAVQPQDVAAMVLAVLTLPQYVDVSRFDILPTHQATATGTKKDK